MPTKTVFIQDTIKAGDPFAVEQPPTAVTGHPYLGQPSPLAIMNEKGSGAEVHVRLLNLRPITGPNALTSVIGIQRITSINGGVQDFPDKMDSANADLPSQVVAMVGPTTVNAVAGSTYRRSMTLSEQNPTRTLAGLCAHANGDARSGLDNGEFIRLTGDGDITGYILREGEGLAAVYGAASPSHCWAFNLRLKNVGTGETYRFNEVVEPRYMNGDVLWAILNGSGSGVVLEVEKIQVREVGTDELVLADYAPIDGIYGSECDGQCADYVMADTADTLPSGITIKKNCVTARAGSKWGALISLPAMRRVELAEPPWGPGIATGPQLARRGALSRDMEMRGESEIVLREGQGLGVFLRNAGAQVFHEATMIIDIVTPDPVSSGARSFAF